MRRIIIDDIITDLKTEPEWQKYVDKISLHLKDFTGVSFTISHFIGKDGILSGDFLNLISNEMSEENVPNDFWKWSKKEDEFIEFKKLEAKFLDIFFEEAKFCPYCGKIPLIRYENDIKEKKGVYHLDHIFPKSKYRHLTYNFYNLIPACSMCNQFKGRRDLNAKKYKNIFHPYFGFIEEVSGIKKINKSKKIDDDFLNVHLLKNNIEFYNLDKIYTNSQDTDNDRNFILDKITKIKVDKKTLRHSFDLNERKKHYFKNFYSKLEKDILKYANGKLKRKLINDITI